jgi:hypothetical protein
VQLCREVPRKQGGVLEMSIRWVELPMFHRAGIFIYKGPRAGPAGLTVGKNIPCT